MIKMHLPKKKPLIITYQKYKNFCKKTFLTSLKHEDDKLRAFLQEKGLDASSNISIDVLEKHASGK